MEDFTTVNHKKFFLVFAFVASIAMALTATSEATNKTLIIPPSSFTQTYHTMPWQNGGSFLVGAGSFTATLNLPAGAHILSLTYYYYDYVEAGDVCVYLNTATPATKTQKTLASSCSVGAVDLDPQSITFTVPTNTMKVSSAPYLTLYLGAFDFFLKFYGVKVVYTTDPV
jgi:hypothetical protein